MKLERYKKRKYKMEHTLKLSHEEIELVITALGFLSGHKTQFANKHRHELSRTESLRIMTEADKVRELSIRIEQSEKDI